MPIILESWALYNLTLLVHFLLYVAAPIILFKRGWPIAGGLVMVASTVLPIGGQTWFTDSDFPGFGLLLMMELPLATLVLLTGSVVSASRLLRERRLSKLPRGKQTVTQPPDPVA